MTATVTVFADKFGKRVNSVRPMDLEEVERIIRAAKPAASKDALSLLKFATFGNKKVADSGCLRHDENALQVTGIEGDYDGEKMPMEAAVEKLRAVGVEALLYTSASHTADKPRWRVLCPLATALEGDPKQLREQRRHWVGVLNAILGGVLKGESFALSQSFYFGRIAGRPDPEIVRLSGVCIDQVENAPKPQFPINGTEHHAPAVADGGIGEDQSADLYKRVGRDLRDGLADYEIIRMHKGHPHALKQPNPERAVQLCINKLRGERKATAEVAEPKLPGRAPLDWSVLEGKEPPEREWLLSYWLPAAHVALLSGKAGIGKTLIAQYIATSVAIGREYIAHVPKARKVLMWAAEDDADEMWRRQRAVNAYFGKPLSALKDKLYLQSYAGADVTLATPIYGTLQPTAMMAELRAQVTDYGAELVIIDNSARVYGGNENDRHSVTTFVAWLQAACAPAAVLLLSHPAKAMGSEYSGSTAWEGAVRARLYMSDRDPSDTRENKNDEDEDAPIDPTVRFVSRRKSNYSALDVRRFELSGDGVLTPNAVDPREQEGISDAEKTRIVREAVKALAERNLYGKAGATSPDFLPKLAAKYKLLGSLTKKQFAITMNGMIFEQELVIDEVGTYGNRHKRVGIRLP